MAERGVLLVVDGCAVRAVVASERAHIPGNHYAVAGADVLLISRGALELTVGTLTDEQRDCRRTASTHDQLVSAADVEPTGPPESGNPELTRSLHFRPGY